MPDSTCKKALSLLQTLDRRFGKSKLPEFMPPPASADMDAALQVAAKNSEVIAGTVLGLHGPPEEGQESVRKLMAVYVDWNEVRVANRVSLARCLGRDPRATERIALMQRFLEAFFLRQRNMNLDCLVGMKPAERKAFLGNLEVFSREELTALMLTCFGMPGFPPSEALHRVAVRCGMLKPKTTVLQMAASLSDGLEADEMLGLYSHLYNVACANCHVEHPKCPTCPLKNGCPAAKDFMKAAK